VLRAMSGGSIDPTPENALSAHGGLTYANKCQAAGPVCHKPAPGEPDDVWWFGFDCGHSGDWAPEIAKFGRRHFNETYRDVGYVRAEVERLREQLSELADVA
jgi:hypothetical protein